jgi:hypothetical protein
LLKNQLLLTSFSNSSIFLTIFVKKSTNCINIYDNTNNNITINQLLVQAIFEINHTYHTNIEKYINKLNIALAALCFFITGSSVSEKYIANEL